MEGYSKLASFMTEKHHPILKKYRHLATRDLLFLQAELCHLDHQYESIAKKGAAEKDERQYYDQDWYLMQSSASRGLDGEQWAVAIATRAKLREYCTSMTFQLQRPVQFRLNGLIRPQIRYCYCTIL
jgi:hypothetical protein